MSSPLYDVMYPSKPPKPRGTSRHQHLIAAGLLNPKNLPYRAQRRLKAPELTLPYLRSIIDYIPKEGLLTWKRSRQSTSKGRPLPFNEVSIDYTTYPTPKIAWYHYHGRWPKAPITFLDGDPTNLKISNLTEAP